MKEAVRRASRQINQKAAERKQRHDKSAKSANIEVGTKILLRNRVQGRNKIQDVWSSIPYKLLGRMSEDNNAYLVERLSDGKVKVVNRLDILPFPIESADDTVDNIANTSESSSDDEVLVMSSSPTDRPATHVRTDIRKSTRTTAGKHSNPHREPRSAIQEEHIAQGIPFTEYSSAILQLGECLSSKLKDSYDNFNCH
jgi:hypothetical protein